MDRMSFAWPGPGIAFSLHNHSSMSDGAGTLEDVCRAGKSMGLRVFGVSDHWVIHPEAGSDAASWRMAPERLPEYVETLLRLRKELEDERFSLKIGLEVDFFFENFREVLAGLEKYPLDYLIGSVHYAGLFPIDHAAEDWTGLAPEEIVRICGEYWRKLEGAARCGAFSFLGHLDLPKKFCYMESGQYIRQACRVLDAAAESSTAIELNTSGWFKPCKAPYPCSEMLHEAALRHIPLLVSADAHHPAHLNRNFAEAERYAVTAGYPCQKRHQDFRAVV